MEPPKKLSSGEIPAFIFRGLEKILDPGKFYREASKIKEQVFSELTAKTSRGTIPWRRVINSKALSREITNLKYTADIEYICRENEYNTDRRNIVILPLTLSFGLNEVNKLTGYLYLGEGDKDDLYIDTENNKSLKDLINEYFKINLSKDSISP